MDRAILVKSAGLSMQKKRNAKIMKRSQNTMMASRKKSAGIGRGMDGADLMKSAAMTTHNSFKLVKRNLDRWR